MSHQNLWKLTRRFTNKTVRFWRNIFRLIENRSIKKPPNNYTDKVTKPFHVQSNKPLYIIVGKFPTDLTGGCNKFVPFCDRVENEFLGDTRYALLWAVLLHERRTGGSEQLQTFRIVGNLQWCYVIKSHFDSASASVLNGGGQLIPFRNCGHTYPISHIRKKIEQWNQRYEAIVYRHHFFENNPVKLSDKVQAAWSDGCLLWFWNSKANSAVFFQGPALQFGSGSMDNFFLQVGRVVPTLKKNSPCRRSISSVEFQFRLPFPNSLTIYSEKTDPAKKWETFLKKLAIRSFIDTTRVSFCKACGNGLGGSTAFVGARRDVALIRPAMGVSSKSVNWSGVGGLELLPCIKMDYSEPTWAQIREGTSILTESSRVFFSVVILNSD